MLQKTNLYQDYLDKLNSSNVDSIIEAAHGLGDLGDHRAVTVLLQLLQTTNNPSIRDAAAVGLKELGDERAVAPLITLLNDPKTEGHRGTLVYALEAFSSPALLPMLVDLVITGNFEVSHQAFLAIESIEGEIDTEVVNAYLQKAKNALSQSSDDKVELLKELIELFEEME